MLKKEKLRPAPFATGKRFRARFPVDAGNNFGSFSPNICLGSGNKVRDSGAVMIIKKVQNATFVAYHDITNQAGVKSIHSSSVGYEIFEVLGLSAPQSRHGSKILEVRLGSLQDMGIGPLTPRGRTRERTK